MEKNKTIFICDSCGNEFLTWSGKCEACNEWNTLKEISVGLETKSASRREVEIKKLSEIKYSANNRLISGISELDRVLGGGFVKGSVILLGGEPGIGKSTLTLQLCENIKSVFYLSAEESLEQINERAKRLLKSKSDVNVVSSGDLRSVEPEILKRKPDLLIIDSIQTVFLSEVPSSPGSLSQVRECGIYLQRFAKENQITVLIIGHVTKEGSIAGPKIVEHLVDVVLYLEGERYQEGRILRGIKNRFGATNEIGLFSLEENGMQEVKNASEIFLAERSNRPGSVISAIMEGKRPLLIEVQALTIATNFGYPKRTSSGLDLNRLNILAAVIQKSTGTNLSNSDIYLNIVGGIKVNEPAVDLAVCAAIISSYKNMPVPDKQCFFGEVGLMGEIRNVARAKDREKECQKLGYVATPKLRDLPELLKKYFIRSKN